MSEAQLWFAGAFLVSLLLNAVLVAREWGRLRNAWFRAGR